MSDSDNTASYASKAYEFCGGLFKGTVNAVPSMPETSGISAYGSKAYEFCGNAVKGTVNAIPTSIPGSSTISSVGSKVYETCGNAVKGTVNAVPHIPGSDTITNYGSKAYEYCSSAFKGAENAVPIEVTESDSTLDQTRKTAEYLGGVWKGAVRNASRFDFKFNTSRSTAVSITDSAAKYLNGKPKVWIRYDRPHPGADFKHINIDRAVTKYVHGVKRPPNHVPISGVHMKTVEATTRVLDGINQVAYPVAVTLDTVAVGAAAYQDYKNGTSRNAVATTATVAAGWVAGYTGAAGGSAIGTAVLPGMGTIIGGLVGGIAGGVSGAVKAHTVFNDVADRVGYDVEKRNCVKCQTTFTAAIYNGEKDFTKCGQCHHASKL
uniref:Filamentous hemagglutinin n=2 Tax=Panagrellus redivivus TaxID=6233 RepID=A0A7E4V842_PANRE